MVGTSYYHKSIGGYHSAKLGRYQDLIDLRLSNEITQLIETLQNAGGFAAVNNKLKELNTINMLNTKYIIYNPQAEPLLNPFANGNAWFAKDIEWVDNANQEIDQLASIDIKNVALIDKRFENQLKDFKPSSFAGNTIKLIKYKPNYLVYESNSTSEQLAIFSEIYYDKGWMAYIDGELSSHFRANYALRAMLIPEGKHKIEFKFIPKSYYTGEKIALIGSILLILSFILIVGFELKSYFAKN